VAQDRYRFRLLNGCNSRFLNLAMFVVNPDGTLGQEIPFYQIGAEQGFLPNVVMIATGSATPLPGDGTIPAPAAADPDQALLMGLAERADVIVDFTGLADGTVIRMINTAPDAPFGGFPDDPADPETTGQVMQFVVDSSLNGAGDSTDGSTTAPEDLALNSEPALGPADNEGTPRQISLNEEVSGDADPAHRVCVCVDEEGEFAVPIKNVDCSADPATFCPAGFQFIDSFGPVAAKLGTVDLTDPANPAGIALNWTDTTGASSPVVVTLENGSTVTVNVTEAPIAGDTEEWDIYNFTEDAHPIHLHLVRFEVVNRQVIGEEAIRDPEPWETGFKDTVISYPGEITKVKALFDLSGLYVWHCHIVEHEDNEMMRPYVVCGDNVTCDP